MLLSREQRGCYARFGGVAQFARVWRAALAASGVRKGNRRRKKGRSPARFFVVFSQNHDQVGNRLCGERLAALVPFEARKLAAATVLLSPFLPLLFKGEEYGERTPFHYFISYSIPTLIQAVRNRRRAELVAFGWQGDPPDPQADAAFKRSKLSRALLKQPRHRLLREFYRELIRLRRTLPARTAIAGSTMNVRAHGPQEVLLVRYSSGAGRVLLGVNYSDRVAAVAPAVSPGRWRTLLDSASHRWNGPGSLVPEELSSDGRVKLSLQPNSVLAFEER